MVGKSEIISIAIVGSTLALSSCASPDETKGIARRTATNCSETKLTDRFFRGVFDTPEQEVEGDVTGVAEFLQSRGESSISCGAHADETYRLIYLPEGGNALSLRAQRRGDHYELIVFGHDTKSASRLLDQADWNRLASAIERYNFWSRSPFPSPSIHNNPIGLHGAAWVLEGQKGEWYHAVSRLSSFKEADFDRPAKAFFEIAKLDAALR